MAGELQPGDMFVEALQSVWALQRTERLRVLRGERVRTFDDRGLHPLSVEVGRLLTLGELMGTSGDLNLFELRDGARADADEVFRGEIVEAFVGAHS